MNRFAKFLMTGVLAAAALAPIASARPPVVVFRGGFYGGPAFYGPAFGWYGPGWYGPYGYAAVPNTGSVKIETNAKSASVYVDGGFAGTVGDLKTFHLKPGSHDIELKAPDGSSFYQERIDVVAGKTLKLTPGS
jgi:PEGA domain